MTKREFTYTDAQGNRHYEEFVIKGQEELALEMIQNEHIRKSVAQALNLFNGKIISISDKDGRVLYPR